MSVDYETTIILNPTLSEDQINTLIERTSQILTDGGATINKVDQWGRRRLAYDIQKIREGFYVFFAYSMEKSPETINKLEHFYRLQEDVMRYLTVAAADTRPRGRRKNKKAEMAQQLVDQKKAEGEAMAPAQAEQQAVTETQNSPQEGE